MDKRTRQVDMLRSKYLRQVVELLEKHNISIEEVVEFKKGYKPISVQMKERRERKLAEQRNLLNLAKAREALAAKRANKEK